MNPGFRIQIIREDNSHIIKKQNISTADAALTPVLAGGPVRRGHVFAVGKEKAE
jgi:putative AlgH/UPF0301 family transcriptional regulator